MRFIIPIVAALLALSGVASQAAAQSSQFWSLQGSLITYTPFGEEFEGVTTGMGGEAQLRYTPGAFSIGGGFQFTRHDFNDPDPFDRLNAVIDIFGFFVEPRYVIYVNPNVAPYLSTRLVASLLWVDYQDYGERGETTGTTLNVGGGLLFRASPRLNLDLGATFGHTDWGDFLVAGDNLGAIGSGTNLVARIGLAYGLGR